MIPLLSEATPGLAELLTGGIGLAFFIGLAVFCICLIVAPLAIWSHVSGTEQEVKKLNKQFDAFFTFYALRNPPKQQEKPSVEDVIL